MLSNFNFYGLTVGIASVVAIWWWEKRLAQLKIKFKKPNLALFLVLFLMTIGARVWHVATDWQLYSQNWWQVLAIWKGGISILGALVGLIVGLALVAKLEKIKLLILLDTAALSLPWAQAIGRFGNYFNRELYGSPTTLPWAIEIAGERVHPLFLYESLLLIIFAIFLNRRFQAEQVGQGKYFRLYLTYYLVVRFFLDFLRVQKTMLGPWLGLNQVIILGVLFFIYAKKH